MDDQEFARHLRKNINHLRSAYPDLLADYQETDLSGMDKVELFKLSREMLEIVQENTPHWKARNSYYKPDPLNRRLPGSYETGKRR